MVTLQLTAVLKDVDNNPLANKTINFYKSTDGVNYTLIDTKTTDASGTATTTDEITATGTYYYKAEFPGDDVYDYASDVETYIYQAGVPQFVLEAINPSSVKVKVGSSFSIQVTIRNDGESGTCKVSLMDHAGITQSTAQDTIEGGSRKTFTLSGTAPNVVTKVTYKVRYEAV